MKNDQDAKFEMRVGWMKTTSIDDARWEQKKLKETKRVYILDKFRRKKLKKLKRKYSFPFKVHLQFYAHRFWLTKRNRTSCPSSIYLIVYPWKLYWLQLIWRTRCKCSVKTRRILIMKTIYRSSRSLKPIQINRKGPIEYCHEDVE